MARQTLSRQADTVESSVPSAAAGASYTFDPAADGVAGIYALRVLERGIDPRALCADLRSPRPGMIERSTQPPSRLVRPSPIAFGRGTQGHHPVGVMVPAPNSRRVQPAITLFGRKPTGSATPWPRRFATAGLVLLLLLPLTIIAAHAQGSAPQSRYIVQPGDTLESVADEFGVDPAAIIAASAIQDPPYLTPAEIIIIPSSGETPEEAVLTASQRVGSSPFVVAAHDVAPGETIARIAGDYGLDPWSLAAFNAVGDVDSLAVGARLRIPLTDAVQSSAPGADQVLAAPAVGGMAPAETEVSRQPVFAADVPAYQQQFSLSCEYAAAYIATAAFGAGVPEGAFLERIGVSANPHWGYRGNIHGPWGGTDDYGIYPEALVPTLNEFGFVGDVFYSGGNPEALTARIDAGMPVVVWLGYFGDIGWLQEDEGSYQLVPGMHVVTAYGYDDGGVYLANPGRGNYDYYTWPDFLAMWQVLDGMSLGIAPM